MVTGWPLFASRFPATRPPIPDPMMITDFFATRTPPQECILRILRNNAESPEGILRDDAGGVNGTSADLTSYRSFLKTSIWFYLQWDPCSQHNTAMTYSSRKPTMTTDRYEEGLAICRGFSLTYDLILL